MFPFVSHPADQRMVIHQEDIAAVKAPEAPDAEHLRADPEHVRAVDSVFVQQKEDPVVAGLLGLWSGSLLLHDLAQDHFRVPVEEELAGKPSLPDEDEDE